MLVEAKETLIDERNTKLIRLKKKLSLEVLIAETIQKMKNDGYLAEDEYQKFTDSYFNNQRFSGTINALFSIFDTQKLIENNFDTILYHVKRSIKNF